MKRLLLRTVHKYSHATYHVWVPGYQHRLDALGWHREVVDINPTRFGDRWELTHLASGSCICKLPTMRACQEVADKICLVTDWLSECPVITDELVTVFDTLRQEYYTIPRLAEELIGTRVPKREY